jgi:hypothetical protein
MNFQEKLKVEILAPRLFESSSVGADVSKLDAALGTGLKSSNISDLTEFLNPAILLKEI